MTNIFDAIKQNGNKHPECEFTPTKKGKPTQYAPGTPQKILEIIRRVERGEPLFHEGDKVGYDGCPPGCVRGSVELPPEKRPEKPIIKSNFTQSREPKHWWEEL